MDKQQEVEACTSRGTQTPSSIVFVQMVAADPRPRTSIARASHHGTRPARTLLSRPYSCSPRYLLETPWNLPLPSGGGMGSPCLCPCPYLCLYLYLHLHLHLRMGSTARIPVVCDRRPAAERGICQVMDGLVALSGHESSLNGTPSSQGISKSVGLWGFWELVRLMMLLDAPRGARHAALTHQTTTANTTTALTLPLRTVWC
ncbi:hypothetical protein V8C44DRAFT_96673 [Trichoderma aethiopicum]